MKIYLDQDGVLADFDRGLADRGIVNDVWFIHKPKSEWTPEQHELDKQVVQCMQEPGFFRNLQPTYGCLDLYEATQHLNPYILTARPNEKVSADRVTKEKTDWIEYWLGSEQAERMIVCLRAEKAQYAVGDLRVTQEYYDAKPNLLVDDLKANCLAWEEAGGIAVWHRGDMEETIKELRKHIG